jgi:hypothetical protein
VTSASRGHVEEFVRRYYKGDRPVGDAIVTFEVESSPLTPLLSSAGFDTGVDVLQIDAEGHDDEVIYASSIDRLRPTLINFEFASLPEDRLGALTSYLTSNGYSFVPYGIDCLAFMP